jgi:hypothetical protein
METEMIFILIWAIIMTITLGILVVILLNLKKKHDQDIRDKENEIQDMNNKLDQKQTKSYRAGVNVTAGDYSQILGEFALLSEYSSIITLSTTSRQPSLDLIGVNEDSLDFIELKKKGAGSSNNEKHIKQLVDEKKVSYKIYDVDLPNNFSINERRTKVRKEKSNTAKNSPQKKLNREERLKKHNLQKIEAQKTNPEAYEPWTTSNDEFLKNYWNDISNKQNKDEKIQELSKKLGRNSGGIKARLKKLRLD